jgi:hypothetical protein
MRRILCCLLLGLLGAVTTGMGIASAHLCTVADQIAVGKLQTISIGVTVEAEPIPDFVVRVPPELRVDRVDPAIGFRVTRQGQTLRYRGGPIQPYTCQYVSLGVTATSKGAYGIPVTQRTADGTVVVRGKTAPAGSAAVRASGLSGVRPRHRRKAGRTDRDVPRGLPSSR